jgi:cerevisin
MRFFTTAVASIALLATPVLGGTTPLRPVEKFNGATTGKYIVKFKIGVSKKIVVNQLGSAVTHDWDSSFLNGFAGNKSFIPIYL